MRKFKKRGISVMISIALTALFSMSQMMTVFAADVSAENYVFSLILRACGVSPGTKVGAWQDAYEGYLEKTGNQALLNQVKGYESLSLGSTAQGVDDLYWSVRQWLSSATVKESRADSCLYELPSSPTPKPDVLSVPGSDSIRSDPFSGPGPLPAAEAETYSFLFADSFTTSYNNGNLLVCAVRNVYAPKGIEVFGVVTAYTDYGAKIRIEYFTPDASSSTGYRSVELKDMRAEYYLSDGSFYRKPNYSISWNWNSRNARANMNYPFKIFATAKDAENYCKTGTVSNLFSQNSITLSSGGTSQGADLELINHKVDSVSSSISLPANAVSASAALSSLQAPMDLDSLSKALTSAGMEVAYTASYKIEHYKRDVSDLDKPVSWIKESEEALSGVVGQEASFKPKSYPSFLYTPELTDPQDARILGDGSLIIRLYYKPDPDAALPYTVEYHKDGEVFETISGTVPMFGDRFVRTCEDLCPQYYLPDNKASTPLPFEVSELKNTIHIYYKRDLYAKFSYTVEYYKDGQLFKTVPGSVSVFDPSIKSCLSYCPSGYALDTSSSTPLPYSVSGDGGVIKNFYVRKETVIPYSVDYYKDGLRMNTVSGNVPSSSPVLQSYPSRCPEYYKLDEERSTPMPYTVPEGGGRVRVYYKKDEEAVFPYTVECYKDGELVESISKTVSVFSPSVKEYGFDCPEGYVVDTSSSTSLPYSVSKEGNVIKYYYMDEGKTLPYTVEYYKDGGTAMTISGNVPVTSPVVKSYWPYSSKGYILDKEHSDSLPFTVTRENNLIRVYYIPDPSDPYASFIGGVKTLANSVTGYFKAVIPWLFILLMLYLFIDKNLSLVKLISSKAMEKRPKEKKKVFTAPRSRFMKGVHANKGSSLRSKANMKKGVRPGSLKSKATISDRRWKGGYSKRR